MKKVTLESRHGYAIPCHDCWEGQDKVVIVCHGFGSSKLSPMVLALNEALPRHGIGVVSFDFPAHGDSPVWEEGLRVPFCVDDLITVEEYVRKQAPQARIGYFGSSFGAYNTLLRLSRGKAPGERAFLRSAAVSMPRLVDTWVDDRAREDMARQGWFVPDYDYVREMRITQDFLDDLAAHDVFARYQTGMGTLRMVHGGRDDVAPTADAERFARQFGAELTILPKGEHNLMGEGELEQVLALAIDFFAEM